MAHTSSANTDSNGNFTMAAIPDKYAIDIADACTWALAQGDDIVPIPGTKHVGYLKENIAALDIDLTDNDLERLEDVAPKGSFAGERYADMSTVNR